MAPGKGLDKPLSNEHEFFSCSVARQRTWPGSSRITQSCTRCSSASAASGSASAHRWQSTSRLEQERDRLRASHERLRQELELFKRRLFIAKAERIDTRQLELEYAQKLRELDTLAGTLGLGKEPPAADDDTPASDGKRRGKRKGNRGTGRRDLRLLPLEEERIEIADPHLEAFVAAGKVIGHGFDESYKLGHKRGGRRRIVCPYRQPECERQQSAPVYGA